MNQAEEAKLLEQLEQWNKKDEYSRCIRAIEAIPEQERGLSADRQAESGLQQSGGPGEIMESTEPTVKWTEISSSTPSDCWSPFAPREKTTLTGTPGWAIPA